MKFTDDVVAAHLRGVSGYNKKGEEIPDPKPLEVPVGFGKPETLEDIMGAMLNRAVQQELAQKGVETFEDADDFEIEDDPPIEAPWQDPGTSEAWTREAELRAGQVEQPNFREAKEMISKGLEALKKTKESKEEKKA